MSEEKAFLAHLAAHPEDENARGAYADWLDEQSRGEEAARQRRMGPGCMALVLADWAAYQPPPVSYWTVADFACASDPSDRSDIPSDWFDAVIARIDRPPNVGSDGRWLSFLNRQECEEMTALAFADLPPERQAELLAATTAV